MERKKAARALARFLRLHPHNIAQKTEVMVEHFESTTRHRIGGRAKAMVVTGSRLEAVRYKQSFDRYIGEKGYAIKSLVAFSGKVPDDKLPGVTYTEEQMNEGIREKQLPEHFATQDYRVLLVAEKYQTGFDQPLLHTMYIDKRLAGIQAVQTLSRLNRIHPLKEDTFVLDFVNDRDEIREAFKVYYEGAEMGDEVDPARMYVVKDELDASGIYLDEEVERFCAVYFKPRQRQTVPDHQAMNAVLDPAVSRFTALQEQDEDEAELWRGKVQAFRNLYGFLSQVNPQNRFELVFQNLLERLFIDRIDQNEEIFVRHMNDEPFQQVVSAWMASEAYRRLRADKDSHGGEEEAVTLPPRLRLVGGRPEERYRTCVPLVPLEVAAGAFSDPQHVDPGEEWAWVAIDTHHRLRPGMFVAQIIGKSMEPSVSDGSYGLFRAPVEGSRQGKTVLVQLRDASDPETGARYTVKRYESEKTPVDDSWRHTKITLKPINPEFEPIVLTDVDEGEPQVVAELIEVISGEAEPGTPGTTTG